jgi:hypothetical protein
MRFPTSVVSMVSALTFSIAIGAAALLASAEKAKPSVSVKANPSVGFAPTRVVMTAELKGGVNDYADYYCPAVEWQWGDDTRAESKIDCEPYEAGKSEIKRRYVFDRVFQAPGDYRVEFRLKQKDKVVGLGATTVRIRPGLRDGGGH